MSGRRANGEGTVYKRADGRYEGAVSLQLPTGKRKRFRVYANTSHEARKRLIKLVHDAQRGTFPSERRWKVDEYLDFWLEHEKRRPLTRNRHEMISRLYLKPGLGHRTLESLTVRSVQGFLDELHAEGKTAATVHQVRKVLSAALTYAMRQELIVRNVARLVELPQYTPREAEHWTPDELVKFLEVAKGDLLYPAFLLLALYGLRRGEVLGIRWCDVDFVQDELHIRQQIQRIGSDLQQVELKTASSRRDEPLLLQAREALLAQREYQTKQRESAAATWRGGDDHDRLVFTTRTGSALESHNLARSFHRICERAGLRRITIHGLRHSNATTQKSLQVHSRDIQAILGHGDVRTTGIYEHVDLASKRAALEKVEILLFDQTDENCRQNCRQDKSDAPELTAIDRPKKTPAPVGQALSLVAPTRLELVTQGSSGVPSSPKTTFATPVGKYVQARRLTPIFGRVAVKIAVKQHVFGDVIFENSEAQLLNSGAATIVRDRDSLAIQMAQARKAAGSPNHMSCPLGHDSEWLLQELTIQLNKPRDLEGAAQMS